jgi:hypothetical protein
MAEHDGGSCCSNWSHNKQAFAPAQIRRASAGGHRTPPAAIDRISCRIRGLRSRTAVATRNDCSTFPTQRATWGKRKKMLPRSDLPEKTIGIIRIFCGFFWFRNLRIKNHYGYHFLLQYSLYTNLSHNFTTLLYPTKKSSSLTTTMRSRTRMPSAPSTPPDPA